MTHLSLFSGNEANMKGFSEKTRKKMSDSAKRRIFYEEIRIYR